MTTIANKVTGNLAGQSIKAQVYAYERKYEWEEGASIIFLEGDSHSDEYKALIGIVDVEFVVPVEYNRQTIQLFALRKMKEDKVEQFQSILQELNEKIAKLEAISYEPSGNSNVIEAQS